MESTLSSLILFPFVGAAILGFFALAGRWMSPRLAGPIASFFLLLSFSEAFYLAGQLIGGVEGGVVEVEMGTWLHAFSIDLPWALRADLLSAVMALVVTGVGLLIHVYSIGYMSKDGGRVRYFAYLNLFCGFMLLLVLASSLPLLFIGWEGVGLCSYLLIGFWFEERKNAAAGRKAFLVNRVGDAGLILAMLVAYQAFGTLDFAALSRSSVLASLEGSFFLEGLALLLFLGCVGKSAQFPLYVWLPDAMAGPTPVSALIHAATMVTAGIYLIARMSFLYRLAPIASDVIAMTGVFTAFFAATIACVQRDIKKVLAFSTVSQLGFMVFAMGIGAYGAGMFHLVTHAFFKALLFLGAGSVIHALGGEQDLHRMGGLKTYLVATTLVFMCGTAAIVGLPLTSGWFSKDLILFAALEKHEWVIFWGGLVTALLTAFYMTRLYCLIFLGTPRSTARDLHEIHESPPSMLWPMWILAFLALLGGTGLFPFRRALWAFFGEGATGSESILSEAEMTWLLTVSVLAVMAIAYQIFVGRWEGKFRSPRLIRVMGLMEKQYHVDDVAMFLGGSTSRFVAQLLRLFDSHVIDRSVNAVANSVSSLSGAVARLQVGRLRVYAMAMGVGSALMTWFWLSGGW